MYRGIGKGPDGLREKGKMYEVSCKFGPISPLAGPRRSPYKPYSTRYDTPIKAYRRESIPYTTIPDDCKNYDPIKTELDRYTQRSIKSGRIYPCNNFENHEGIKDGCLFCCNWVTFNGEDKGHKSSPEKMVTYYISLYKNDAEKFIRFFKKRHLHSDKKKILEGILECDFVNEEVIKYLDDYWQNLIRETGFSMI